MIGLNQEATGPDEKFFHRIADLIKREAVPAKRLSTNGWPELSRW
jgi:hypothetical protein